MRKKLSWLGYGLPLGTSLLALGCHVSVHGSARADGSSKGQSGQNSVPAASKPAPTAPSASGSGSKSNLHLKGRVAGKWSARTKLRAKLKWSQPACEQIGPAESPPAFVGVTYLHGEGTRKLGPQGSVVDRTQRVLKVPANAKPTSPPASPAPPVAVEPRQPVQRGTVPGTPALANPVVAPETPPDNVFGYTKPVRGCFEGQVFFLPDQSGTLPASYEGLEASSVVYACEWDIPTRAWSEGFPGIAQRFEWFAIRYSGKFAVAKTGNYGFRVSSDDGSRISIDGKLVVDNDGLHGPRSKSGGVELTPGDHTMVLEYFQGPRFKINLQVYVTPPEGEEGLFSVR